jgi:antitoxin YefM
MRATTTTELRANLARMMDQVNADHTPLLITRAGSPNAVLISEEDWSSMEETLHLLRSPKNAERLLRSIAEADAGKAEPRALIEE